MENNLSSPDYQHKFNECDERFSSIFELTTAASKIIDQDLTILSVNKALTELVGYTADELVGTKIMEYACRENVVHWHELQKAMWDDGRPNFKLDACIVRKDGTLAWVHVTTIAFKENNVRYAFTILDDFTDQKKLKESEIRLSMALQYSKMAVFELNLVDRSIIRSQGFNQLFGLAGAETDWNEEDLLSALLPEDQPVMREVLANIQPEQNFDHQARITTPDGIIKWINFQGRAEKLPDSSTGRLLGTIYDITRDKLIERQKDDFITIASHELKTPLTSLNGSLQLLERSKDALDPKLAALIAQSVKSMTRVKVLVDDLLNASRLGDGQLALRKTHFNLIAAIDECCLHVTSSGMYDIIIDGLKHAEVEADPERIQRVVINLVNNAVKYAPKSKHIIIRVDKDMKANIKVSVIDKGPGIAKEKQPYLFDRYYRADNPEGQYSGLGLGLYISAEIIRRHGGQIGVDSEIGKGTTFWFTLPAA